MDTIQKSYGLDNSGAIYMSDRKLFKWCVMCQEMFGEEIEKV